MSEPSAGTPGGHGASGTPVKNQYRTTPAYQLDDRRLVLRGGTLDGQEWTGVVDVGKRVFCGSGEWSTDGVYLVTAQLERAADGQEANVAVPAFAPE
ncbi:hypothetical protein ACIB24_08950 [Spongisporangium articulatum]|uniref:Uncharacterized protein n=1 Tax=Spongisporangium articulatum TaxID=3362603 RepID=A0ABW8ALF7_9ACTN